MTIQMTPTPQHHDRPRGARESIRRETGRRELTEARRARDIVSLLHQRDELRGVHSMADLIDDAVRWTA